MIKSVCVYCASSSMAPDCHKREAYRLGEILSERGVHCYYGGGRIGLMGELARAMVEKGGSIQGIIPKFMVDEGWDNPDVEEIVVESMHVRKARMVVGVDAAIALPGGCGTFEELLEVITWKQLGIFTKPIIIVNSNGYYDPLLKMLEQAKDEHFIRPEHLKLWSVVSCAEEVLPAIENAPSWGSEARIIAAI